MKISRSSVVSVKSTGNEHFFTRCHAKRDVCRKCKEQHNSAACLATVTACANCDGQHVAGHPACQVRKKGRRNIESTEKDENRKKRNKKSVRRARDKHEK